MKRGLFLLPMLLAACTSSLVEGGGLGGPLGRFGQTLTGKAAAPAPVPEASSSAPTPSPIAPTPAQPTASPVVSPSPDSSPTPTPTPDASPTPSPVPTPVPTPTPYDGPFVTTMCDDLGHGPPTYLDGLFGVVHDRAGGAYLADKTHQIRHFSYDGTAYPFGIRAGAAEAGWVDGIATEARFNSPHGLAIDGVGNLYVADSGNHVIRRLDASGRVLTILGNRSAGFLNGTALQAQLFYPTGVAVDGTGGVYVADYGNHAIRMLRAGVVSTLAGGGIAGYVDAAGDAARFSRPAGVAVAGDRHVFVADAENHCIREITPTGDVSTLAGNGTPGRLDGMGKAARFDGPRGIALEASGSLLVADANNHQIRRVFRTGRVVTIMGTGAPGTRDSRDPLQAQFSLPSTVTVDPDGKVWVADTNNNRVRLYFPGKK